TPLIVEGTSTTALSVSSSMTGWPSETLAPGAIISRTRSPELMFSPSSGSLNSLAEVDEIVESAGRSLWGAAVAAISLGAVEAREGEIGASEGALGCGSPFFILGMGAVALLA